MGMQKMPDEIPTTEAAPFPDPWKVEWTGACVATIRGGENAVELQSNRDGTFSLTVFTQWNNDDLTAHRLTRQDLAVLKKAIEAVGVQ